MDAYSVGELNKIIKQTVEGEFLLKNCIVEGVISNVKRHSTGHYYFLSSMIQAPLIWLCGVLKCNNVAWKVPLKTVC